MRTISYIKYNNWDTKLKLRCLHEFEFMLWDFSFTDEQISSKDLWELINKTPNEIKKIIEEKNNTHNLIKINWALHVL